MSREFIEITIGSIRIRLKNSDGGSFELDEPLQEFVESPEDSPFLPPPLDLTVRHDTAPSWPEGKPVFQHRAGWKVFSDSSGYQCVLPIPPDSEKIERHVSVEPTLREGVITIPPGAGKQSQPLAYLLTEVLTLLLSHRVPLLLLHSAGVVIDNHCCLFSGTSGSGKSTIAKIFSDAGFKVTGDESHIVYPEAGGVWASGTPWPGSSRIFSNTKAPLSVIFLIEHAGENFVMPDAPSTVGVRVMSHSFVPYFSREATARCANVVKQAVENYPVFTLGFVPDKTVTDHVRKILDEQKA